MSETTKVTARVLQVTPMLGRGKLLALADAEIVIDGVAFTLCGVQVLRSTDPQTGGEAIAVDAPRYRAPDGQWRLAAILPEDLRKPLAHAILDECTAMGITRRKARGLSEPSAAAGGDRWDEVRAALAEADEACGPDS